MAAALGLMLGAWPAMPARVQDTLNPSAAATEAVVTDEGREIHFDVTAGLAYQLDADIDNGGDFSLSRFSAGLGVQTDFDKDIHLRVRAGFGLDSYNFGGNALNLGGAEPWSDVHTIGFDAVLSYDINDYWTLFGGPIIQFSRETGADWTDSITGGGGLGAAYHFSKDFTLGGGLIVSSQIEDDIRIFPILIVNWRISDSWRLSSRTESIATGFTGIELVYDPASAWEFALGGAQRFSRFRLDDTGIAPHGVGQDESTPFWLRASYTANSHFRVDARAGVNTGGTLRIEDSNGNRISKSDYSIAPFFGVWVNFTF